ncbi:MAG: hypothetical protein H8E66_29265 [Planctomycetes bacterium]|nr:hypothetical protein [Planctomycetota bacterium]
MELSRVFTKESRVAGEQHPDGLERHGQPASNELPPSVDLVEPVDWISRRLLLRSDQATHESDIDRGGVETVIGWLVDDEHVFEQKYRTHISNVGGTDDPKEFNVIAEQLYRLRYRCCSLLVTGLDPADPQQHIGQANGHDSAYTCPIPTRPISLGSLEVLDRKLSQLSKDQIQDRFVLTGKAILGVANWIQRREFDVTSQNSVND